MAKQLILLLSILSCFTFSAQAQKYGHLNFGNLIILMPETAQADKNLASFQQQLTAQGEKMAKEFQTDYQSFATQVQNGSIAPVEQMKIEKQLQEKQQKIVRFEQEFGQQIEVKRKELLSPIVDKIDQAIRQVAQENGYTLIFDTNVFNAVHYAAPSEDVTSMVKAKLGLQ